MEIARSRPLLGTFVTIRGERGDGSLGSAELLDATMTAAFTEADRLQAIFSSHDPQSDINRYNSSLGPLDDAPLETDKAFMAKGSALTWAPELLLLISRARELQLKSENYFWPYRSETSREFDLGGIAKGFIVDRMIETLLKSAPDFKGVINAGGDLRFVGGLEFTATVRLGLPENHLFRDIALAAPRLAFASSSPSVAVNLESSTTRYRLSLAPGLTASHTVCIAAGEAWLADALTKVALHAPGDLADRVAREYEASMVVFDASGAVVSLRGLL